MGEARDGAAAVLLDDRRELITGGVGINGVLASATAEVLDPHLAAFAAVGSMQVGRSKHAAVKLLDGRVLVTGGPDSNAAAIDVAEIFDPSANTWSPAGQMAASRSGHTASILKDGRVLLSGGEGSQHAGSTLELFDPVSGGFSWAPTALTTAVRIMPPPCSLAQRTLTGIGRRACRRPRFAS